MAKTDVKTTHNAKDEKGNVTKTRKALVTVDFADDLAGLTKQFGDAVVASHAIAALTVAIQNEIRSAMGEGTKDDELQKTFGGRAWKPEAKKRGKSEMEKMRDRLAKLDPEIRRKLLKEAAAA